MGAAIGAALIAKMAILYPPVASVPPATPAQLATQTAKQNEFYNGLGEAIGTSLTTYLKANAEITPAGSPQLQTFTTALNTATAVTGKGKIT